MTNFRHENELCFASRIIHFVNTLCLTSLMEIGKEEEDGDEEEQRVGQAGEQVYMMRRIKTRKERRKKR